MSANLECRFFGGISLQLNQQPIMGLASRKADALIAYLLCNPQIHPREVLADLLWDDRTSSQAMGNLRVVLNSIKNELPSLLTITRQTVYINRTNQLWADVIVFDDLVGALSQRTTPVTSAADSLSNMPRSNTLLPATTVDSLHSALDLYVGEFLSGFHLRDAHQFEEWMIIEREGYHISAVRAAQTLAYHYLTTQEYRVGVVMAQRWVQLEWA